MIPRQLDKTSPPGYTKNSSGGWFGTDGQLPRRLINIFLSVNRSDATGRLTRCRGKDNCYSDDHDPNDDVDRDPLKLSLVHWHSPPF